MNLTDEQLNIAICEWRGWRKCHPGTWPQHWESDERAPTAHLPSHITGIEALGNMHEAVAQWAPDADEMRACENHLHAIVAPHYTVTAPLYVWCMMNATARQRAIALLRVVRPEVFE